MAASFGVWEVRFPSSRAVYDDDEDEDEDPSILEEYSKSIVFHWAPDVSESFQTSLPRECPLLVLAFGEVAATFLEAHLLKAESKILACISPRKENEPNFENLCVVTKSAANSCLYRASGHNEAVICHCRNPVPPERAFHWTEKLFQNFKPSQVVILTSSPACEYHTSDPGNLKSDFIKVLKTDSWQERIPEKECSFLETPNIVSGLAASVLQYCQIYHLAAALFVCYTESSQVDSRSVEAFQFLLKTSPLNSLPQASDDQVMRVLKSLGAGKLIETNMYT
ncbi:proteasome assembly chaperone 1-like isoform X1 [Montipora foliosa]|uniref:proteasome assembly chaperone 1-like isoform X1 n=1 Tax=Montipora foliosa TaxID=591990 RepID=UPI0035F1077A